MAVLWLVQDMFNTDHIQQILIVPLREKMEIESLNHLILRLREAFVYNVSLTVGSCYLLMYPFGIFSEISKIMDENMCFPTL